MLSRAVPIGGGGGGATRSCRDKRNIPPNDPKHATVYLKCPSACAAVAVVAVDGLVPGAVDAGTAADAEPETEAAAAAVEVSGGGHGAVTGNDKLDTHPNFSQTAGRGGGCACTWLQTQQMGRQNRPEIIKIRERTEEGECVH